MRVRVIDEHMPRITVRARARIWIRVRVRVRVGARVRVRVRVRVEDRVNMPAGPRWEGGGGQLVK